MYLKIINLFIRISLNKYRQVQCIKHEFYLGTFTWIRGKNLFIWALSLGKGVWEPTGFKQSSPTLFNK